MKVIFLDVDGVLNSEEFLKNNPNRFIDRKCVSILKDIIDKTGAVIVLSSGWRLWFSDNLMPVDGHSQCLYYLLNSFNIKLYSKTPDFSTDEIRARKTFSYVKAKEILAWINDNDNVEKYVVIDDLDLINEQVNKNLIRTNGKIGITKEDAKRAIMLLSNTSLLN